MAVSAGFYKKIEQWVLNPQLDEISFQPFQTNGNPYRSNVFLIGETPEPYLQIDADDLDLYAQSLVDREVFQELFYEELKSASREYRGCIHFMDWMKENYNEVVVFSYLNCLHVEDPNYYKELKMRQDPLYAKGMEILPELLDEFAPKMVIVQGAANWKQFIERFEEQLIDVTDIKQSVQQLESKGVLAKLPLTSGESVSVLACRSMGNFGKTGSTFGELKQIINQLLNNGSNSE
ncbi:hypothetical protein [Ureibacillus manganicus]|uniref:Uracil-DNA glycosylase-like domain-containing protein n=1 Tax=Ureibacillus manganicus DSM 26584 TaxID=1384049 RepID=A0A0A3I707_9BACL|nr:hypothetical protein [Ureibacillus manganicus]KGR79270.1 hypothetical protein CD29_06115 [Ureibacillus manganicus DSM 26584]